MNMHNHRRTGLDTRDEANARMIRENRARRIAPVWPEPKAKRIDKAIVWACLWAWVLLKLAGWI